MAEVERADLTITLQNRFKKKAHHTEVNALKALLSASEDLQKKSFFDYNQARQVLRNCLMILHKLNDELKDLETEAMENVTLIGEQDGSHFSPADYEKELIQEKQNQKAIESSLEKIEGSLTMSKKTILHSKFMEYFVPETEHEKDSLNNINAATKITEMTVQDCLVIYKNIKANLRESITDNTLRKQEKLDKNTKNYAQEQAAQQLKLETLKTQKQELEKEKALLEQKRQSKTQKFIWRYENLDGAIESKMQDIASIQSMIEDIGESLKTAEEVYNKLNEEHWIEAEVRQQKQCLIELQDAKKMLQRLAIEKIKNENLLAQGATLEKYARKTRLLADLKKAEEECARIKVKRNDLEALEEKIHQVAGNLMNIPALIEITPEKMKNDYCEVLEQLGVMIQPYTDILLNFPKLGIYYLAECTANVDSVYWPGIEGMMDAKCMNNMLYTYVQKIQERTPNPIHAIDTKVIEECVDHVMVSRLSGVKKLLQNLFDLLQGCLYFSLNAIRVQTPPTSAKFFESSTRKYLRQSVQSAAHTLEEKTLQTNNACACA